MTRPLQCPQPLFSHRLGELALRPLRFFRRAALLLEDKALGEDHVVSLISQLRGTEDQTYGFHKLCRLYLQEAQKAESYGYKTRAMHFYVKTARLARKIGEANDQEGHGVSTYGVMMKCTATMAFESAEQIASESSKPLKLDIVEWNVFNENTKSRAGTLIDSQTLIDQIMSRVKLPTP